MNDRPALPPTHLPTLTEVIRHRPDDAGSTADPSPTSDRQPRPTQPAADPAGSEPVGAQGNLHVGVPTVAGEFVSSIEPALDTPGESLVADGPPPAGQHTEADPWLTQRVLAELQRHLDAAFDLRLRAAVAPALARASQLLVDDLRGQLGDVLRDTVSLVVAQELARQRRR